MTLNNPSGVEIMTAENDNHIQVSCIALISCERIALFFFLEEATSSLCLLLPSAEKQINIAFNIGLN